MNALDKNSNYPLMSQSERDNAPWNEVDYPEKEIEVTVSITLSKTMKIKVSDYEIIDSGKDEDGKYFEDIDIYSTCDLKKEVEEQTILPQYAYQTQQLGTKTWKDLKDWNVDDFEVVLE